MTASLQSTESARDDGSEQSNGRQPPVDPLQRAERLVDSLLKWAADEGLPSSSTPRLLMELNRLLIAAPRSTKLDLPEWRRDFDDAACAVPLPDEPTTSSHPFFGVLKARASRRDFGSDPLDTSRLVACVQWTLGTRTTVAAYDYSGLPQRFSPSAGGLNSVDAYVIVGSVSDLPTGAYYFDPQRGLVVRSRGFMVERLASLGEGQEWLVQSSAVVVLVANLERLEWKYGPMAYKLAMLDIGVAAGQLHLVATALELRSTLVGSLPIDELRTMLRLDDDDRIPVAAVALGTRGGSIHG